MQQLLGDGGAAAVKGLLASAQQSHAKGLAAAVSVLTLLVGATRVFGKLQRTLEQIWGAPASDKAVSWWRVLRSRLLSVGLVLGVGFLLIVSVLASAALAGLGEWLRTYMLHWDIVLPALDLLMSMALSTFLFAMIYKYVPSESIAGGDV